MLQYILQTIAFQLFFLIIYDFFLKKETFFNLNRTYLLATAILSVVLPFIQIQRFKNVVPKEFVMSMPEVILGNTQNINANQAAEIVATESSKLQWSWELVFYIGASVALAIFTIKLIKIVTLIYKNPKYWNQNLRIVTLLKSNVAFSFFYYVFLGEQIKESDKPTILKHESVHVNQRHTLDLLFLELLKIVFWFNPLIYMYQSRMSSLHEFIADAEAVKSQNKKQYYQDLLNQIFETKNVSFINAFYKKSLIKKRIVMLSKAKSKQTQLIKYTLLIPVVFGMLLYTSSNAQDKTKVETVKENKTTQELTDQELKDKYYVEMLELYDSRNTDEIFKNVNVVKEKYLNTRDEYYRFQAQMKVMFDKMGDTYTGDKNSFLEKLNKTYAEYLEWKKTDEAKEIWENNTSDGVLKMVVNKLGNLTEEEKKRHKKLIQLMFNDNYFHSLIVSDGLGYMKSTIEDYKPETSKKEKNAIQKVKQTQTQDPIEVPFATVEDIPMLPSCENLSTQNERRNCVASKISKHVQDNFNIKVAGKLGLTGKQRITVIFKIDTNGNVVKVKSRASHPDLEAEAIRVIKTLPQFMPGKQNGERVIVPYALPITFIVNDGANGLKSLSKVKSNSTEIIEKQELNEVPFAVIDQVPIYSGCENFTNQKEQRQCMVDSISKFVQKNFNTDLAANHGLTGRQRISTVFKIDTLGNVVDIRSRAPIPELEDEAKRVISALPQFIPGKQNGEKVVVPYSLPIVFQVAERSDKKTDKLSPIEKTKYEKSLKSLKDQANKNALPFAIVDKVPSFPVCQSLSNSEQRECVSNKIIKIVQKNFNTDMAEKLGIKGKRQIMVVFQINKEGNLQNIRARGPHPDLEAEAIRTVKLLPKFIPGEHKGKKVNVSYSLPIVFMVQ